MLKTTLIATLALCFQVASAESAAVDYLIRGGRVFDGTGSPARKLDIAIAGDRILAIGPDLPMVANKVIDATGLFVAPGFIDLHTHSDRSILQKQTRNNLNYLTQGVTTIVTGNCGSGPIDIAAMYGDIDQNGAGSNVIHLIPQGSLRRSVMGLENRTATGAELDELRSLVKREMTNGSWGMSTGLIYTPGAYSTTEELIELARVVGEFGGIYASHIRGEGKTSLLNAVREAIAIGRAAGAPIHISHFKASGKDAWGMVQDSTQIVEQARSDGLMVTVDQYPYTASSTSVAAMLISPKDRAGGNAELIARLKDEREGARIRNEIEQSLERRGGPETIRIASFSANDEWVGKSLGQIAEAEGKGVIDIVVEIQLAGGASAVSFSMSDQDVEYVMQKPYAATASDGSARQPGSTKPHPRSYGCFPRKIARYAIERKVLPIEQAVRSCSGLPADILGMTDRGYLKRGHFADIVVFDPNQLRDLATFENPHQYSTGVKFLWVNGELTIAEGQYQDILAGKALRK